MAIPQFNNLKKQSAEQIAAANARSVYTAGMAWKALNDNQTTGEIGKDELKDLLGDKFTNNEGTYTFDVEEESATWEGTIKGYEVEGTYSSDESEDKD